MLDYKVVSVHCFRFNVLCNKKITNVGIFKIRFYVIKKSIILEEKKLQNISSNVTTIKKEDLDLEDFNYLDLLLICAYYLALFTIGCKTFINILLL
jgi:hypothetical protein